MRTRELSFAITEHANTHKVDTRRSVSRSASEMKVLLHRSKKS